MNKKIIMLVIAILCLFLFIGFSIAEGNVSVGDRTGDYGYTQLWNFSSGDLIVNNIMAQALDVNGSIFSNQYVLNGTEISNWNDLHTGFTGSCISITYSRGIAVSCND